VVPGQQGALRAGGARSVLIKRKDFGISVALDARRVARPGFLADVVDGIEAAAPFVQFLTKSVGLTF